jgi:hypothetical protein
MSSLTQVRQYGEDPAEIVDNWLRRQEHRSRQASSQPPGEARLSIPAVSEAAVSQ